MRFFIDTNVLIYTRDFREPAKQRIATQWLTALTAKEAATVNLQVLNEVCHVALRKLTHLSTVDIRSWVAELRAFGDLPLEADLIPRAWDVRLACGFSWFDCLLLSAALHMGCTHFLTEDLRPDSKLGGLLIVDPFRTPPSALLSGH